MGTTVRPRGGIRQNGLSGRFDAGDPLLVGIAQSPSRRKKWFGGGNGRGGAFDRAVGGEGMVGIRPGVGIGRVRVLLQQKGFVPKLSTKAVSHAKLLGRCAPFRIQYAEAMNFPNPHAAIDQENRERDRRLAALIRRHPDRLRVARENLGRWLAGEAGRPHPALMEWQAILEFLTPLEIADFLESRTPKAERLRQSSPCVGMLEESSGRAAVA